MPSVNDPLRKLEDHYCYDFHVAIEPTFNVDPTLKRFLLSVKFQSQLRNEIIDAKQDYIFWVPNREVSVGRNTAAIMST